jgi:hypothetical protein
MPVPFEANRSNRWSGFLRELTVPIKWPTWAILSVVSYRRICQDSAINMKTKTEELLNALFWCMDALANPTFRNLTDSYESWAYRRGFLRQMEQLERAKLV